MESAAFRFDELLPSWSNGQRIPAYFCHTVGRAGSPRISSLVHVDIRIDSQNPFLQTIHILAMLMDVLSGRLHVSFFDIGVILG